MLFYYLLWYDLASDVIWDNEFILYLNLLALEKRALASLKKSPNYAQLESQNDTCSGPLSRAAWDNKIWTHFYSVDVAPGET